METQSHCHFCHYGVAAAVVLMVSQIIAGPAFAADAEGFGTNVIDAFKAGEFDVNFRYRYEFVDRDSRGPADLITKNANASTLRTRLVYKSGKYKNLFLTLNMDDLRSVVANNYNSTRNGKTQYPIVADPKGTDLNLASITYEGLENGTLVFGRQRINRANQRFVGTVAWRQNEQTFDAASVDYTFAEKGKVFYAYVDRVKRIFGPNDGPAPVQGSFSSNSNLLDASYEFTPLLNLSGYAYLLDFGNAPNFSSQTLGLRLTGKRDVGDDLGFSYAAQYAAQQDYEDNPNNYDEGYYLVEAGLDWPVFGFKLGYEVLEGSGTVGESFQTPLGTNHKFNGWADQFLVTPGSGLQDAYLQGTAKVFGGKFSLVYHDFSAQTGGADYGQELDLKANWSFLKHYSILVGFALFDVDSNSPIALHSDISKAWLMLTAAF